MCGVFGFAAVEPAAATTVLDGLRSLEYRGYDSWGIAIAADGRLQVERRVGRIGDGAWTSLGPATVGLGHTRWATHGKVTEANAHPHTDCTARFAVVHNGIVENHDPLREELRARGHRFTSETDTEVIAHLLEEEMAGAESSADAFTAAVRAVAARLEGASAIVALDARGQQIVALRHGSPLLLGLGPETTWIASDAAALLPYSRDVVFLQDGEVAWMQGGALRLSDAHTGRPVAVQPERLTWTADDAGRGVHDTYMGKEVAEQPALWRRWADADVLPLADAIRSADRLLLFGCGTAHHAALAGRLFLAELAGLPSTAIVASEPQAVLPEFRAGTLCLALSQSGETADVLDTARLARQRGATVAAVVNAPGSSLSRLADMTLPLDAGPEQCVLATKSFTAKLAALLLLAATVGGQDAATRDDLIRAAILGHALLEEEPRAHIRQIAAELARTEHLFVLGRGRSYPLALEAALKVKEGSYLHAEGFPGGELKHGVIALVEAGTPCLVLAPDDATRSAMLSGASEVSARGGSIIGMSRAPWPVFDRWLPVPEAASATVLIQAMVGQLLAYEIAIARGVDPDRPRNLAKSVTVR